MHMTSVALENTAMTISMGVACGTLVTMLQASVF
jgi:hypothetical protein